MTRWDTLYTYSETTLFNFQVAGQQIIQAQPAAGLQAATLRAAAPTAAAAAASQAAAAAQQIITLPNGQQAIVAGAAAAAPQIMQMPTQTVQQMALVPVSGPNGQTVYQQVPVPVQVAAPAQTTALVPVAVQTSSGQQIIMQQVRISKVWVWTLLIVFHNLSQVTILSLFLYVAICGFSDLI